MLPTQQSLLSQFVMHLLSLFVMLEMSYQSAENLHLPHTSFEISALPLVHSNLQFDFSRRQMFHQ